MWAKWGLFLSAVTALGFATPAFADFDEVPPKTLAEKQTGLFFFDWGSEQGYPDGDDLVIDLLATCGGQRPVDVLPSPLAMGEQYFSEGHAEKQVQETDKGLKGILEDLKIEAAPHAGIGNPAIARHYSGSKLTVVVLPDVHQSLLETTDRSDREKELAARLHMNQASGFVGLVEDLLRQSRDIVYLLEGSLSSEFKYYETSSPTETKAQRKALYEKLIKSHPHLISQEVAEVFRGQMKAFFIDDKQLFLNWMVHLFNYVLSLDQGRAPSWPEVKAKISSVYDSSFEETEMAQMESAFKALQGKSEGEIKMRRDQLCDQRSAAMAEQTLVRVRETKATVAFARIGASHVGGFTQVLRQKKISHIVVSPNL